MPVEFYVGTNRSGREEPPVHSHEFSAVLGLARRLSQFYGPRDELVALISSPDPISLDVMVVTQRGIGVLEMKHHAGLIDIERGSQSWLANFQRINAGSDSNRAKTPHEQVQGYASSLRRLISSPSANSVAPALPGRRTSWESYKYHTAVCFTNPRVGLAQVKSKYDSRRVSEAWEVFSILTPDDFVEWVSIVAFSAEESVAPGQYQAILMKDDQIRALAERCMKARRWTLLEHLIAAGYPYGYLVPLGEGTYSELSLIQEVGVIGRSSRADIKLPDTAKHASGMHAEIRRALDGADIKDSGSSNGTFVNGRRIDDWTRIEFGDTVSFGGHAQGGGVAIYEFSKEVDEVPPTVLNSRASSDG